MRSLLGIWVIVTAVFVAGGLTHAATWNVPGDFVTIQEAVNSDDVIDGDQILVGPGGHAGAKLTKELDIKGEGGALIDDGPVHSSGLIQGFRLLAGSDGTTISHLRFEVDFAIMNAAAVDNITIDHCTFTNAVQAISNWGGSGWQISHNVISDLRTSFGGGTGIMIADYTGGIITGNVISHNKISGTLHVDPHDSGGYTSSGIMLFADFRWYGAGAERMSDNRVVKNKVGLVLDDPRQPGTGDPIDLVALQLIQLGGPPPKYPPAPAWPVIFDNSIGFNDWRRTDSQVAYTPDTLEQENDISRNLGDNRGKGLHPSVFGPGGN
jgi:hypothetical protein